MCRISRAERMSIWQDRLDRYAVSNLTVTDFCKNEGVSAPSYYYWKRRLSASDRDLAAAKQKTSKQREMQADKTASTAFAELVVTGPQATAQAQLPNGVSISLGCDRAIAGTIVDRLLAYEPATASWGTVSRSSC